MEMLFDLEHPAVQAVTIDEQLRFNTHSTGGEHALKESGSWQHFVRLIEAAGDRLPIEDEDAAFEHYLAFGFEPNQGLFCRAYEMNDNGGSVQFIAGLALSPTTNRGWTVDAAYARNAHLSAVTRSHEEVVNTMVASGVHEMLSRNIIQYFCGQYGLPLAHYVDLPFSVLQTSLQHAPERDSRKLNRGLQRGLSDFAFTTETGYLIPMPGFVTRPLEDATAEKLDELREKMPENFNGVLCYLPEDSEARHDDFYRHRQFIGRVVSERKDRKLHLTGSDQAGQPVEFAAEHLKDDSLIRVSFLKALALRDPAIAQLFQAPTA